MGESVSRRLLLRVAAKLLALLALAALGAVGIAGLFPPRGATAPTASFPLASLAPDQAARFDWNGHRIIVVRRAAALEAKLGLLDPALADPQARHSEQPANAPAPTRAAGREIFVALDYDPDFGCPLEWVPAGGAAPVQPWIGGFRAPCSGSWFDPAGRVYLNQPTAHNLRVPPHHLEADRLVVGN